MEDGPRTDNAFKYATYSYKFQPVLGGASISSSHGLLGCVQSHFYPGKPPFEFIAGLPAMYYSSLAQDFMYRRFVGSLCRVLWCCCCSWPSKASGDKSDSRVAPTNAIHEAANQSNPVSIAPLSRSIIIAETMEEGEAGSAIILPPRPARLSSSPARTVASRRSMTLATPCVSRDDIMVAPMRPARPLRMAADGGYGKRRVRTAQDDAAGGVAVVTVRRQPRAGVVGGSSSGRRKHRKRVTKARH